MGLRINTERVIDVARLPRAEQQVLAGLGAKVTLPELEDELRRVAGSDPGRAEILRRVAQRELGANPINAIGVQILKGLDAKKDPALADFLRRFDAIYFGQAALKRELMPVFRYLAGVQGARHAPKGPPKALVLAGDYGTGKTFLPKALSAAMYPGEAEPPLVTIDAAALVHGGTEVGGAAPQFVGFGRELKLSEANLNRVFKGRRPRIIVIDDLDKIQDPDVEKRLLNMFGGALNDGFLNMETTNERVDLRGDLIVFTGNFGVESARKLGLAGEAAKGHMNAAAVDFFATAEDGHLVDRIRASGGFFALDALSAADRGRIIAASWDRLRAEVQREVLEQLDVDVTLEPLGRDVLELFAEVASTARRARSFVDGFLEPMVRHHALADFEDNEVWQLRLGAPEEVRELRRAMRAIAGDPEKMIPTEYAEDSTRLPFGLAKVVGAPVFAPGDAKRLPRLAEAIASGVCNGAGWYFAAGAGGNELYVVGPQGARKAALPKALKDARAMFPIQAVTLDEHRVLAIGVDHDEQQGVARTTAFVFDFSVLPPKHERVQDPPVALQGAALGAAGGVALLAGGRVVTRGADGWSVPLDAAPEDMNGRPIDGPAYRFDAERGTWSVTREQPALRRFGAAAIEHNGELWLIGGEETYNGASARYGDPQGLRISRASSDVLIYDPASDTFRDGPSLPTRLVFPAVMKDGQHRLRIAGGYALEEGSGRYLPSRTIYRVAPSVDGAWKASGALPGVMTSAHLARVPVGPGETMFGPLGEGLYLETRPRVPGA